MGLESSKLKLGDIPERDPLDEDLVSVNDLDALELHDLLASKVSFYTIYAFFSLDFYNRSDDRDDERSLNPIVCQNSIYLFRMTSVKC